MTDIQADDYGKLTDGSFVRARQRIGIPQVLRNPPHNFEVSEDGSRHFAFGYGDDNPLYCDPAYAKQTRWGNLIAPPTFQYTVGQNITPPPDPETKALLRGDPWAGLGSYQARMDFEWWRPFNIGDRVYKMRSWACWTNAVSSVDGRRMRRSVFRSLPRMGRPSWSNAVPG